MKEYGSYLRRAREAAGLSLEDLHERTRISLKNLRLIESGDFPSIPQTYVRAFVREYARSVGLDEEDTIAAYNESAEREKGIPRPPAAIDSSNLLPKVDDTVEFVHPFDRPPTHVEVNGVAEVESEEFVPPVRKSTYVREGDAAAIDIRTSAHAEFDSSAAVPPPPAARGKDEKQVSTARPPEAAPSAAAPEPIPRATAAESAGAPEARPAGSAEPPRAVSPPTEPPRAVSPPAEPPRSVSLAASPEPAQKNTVRPPMTDRAPAPQPLPPVDSGSEKRVIGLGLLVLVMIVVAIYGIYFFSSGGGDESATVDSTTIKASIEAGRFIDSTQAALTDIEIAPVDTATLQKVTPPDPVEARQRVFAREDSLVLEAFTNAPVWFSVKMDTLRSERGSLSSNEHRIWKARDYFVITLGDAGAVTFFLNGKEIGTLGEEGAVVKNVTLSRQQLNGN